MKRYIALSAMALALMTSMEASARPPWADQGFSSGHGLERRVAQMTERLDLTPQQQGDIRVILEARCTQRNAERAAMRGHIDDVLTEEQRVKRDTRMEQRLERRVARLADRLNISPAQEAELKTAMVENRDNPVCTLGEMRERLSAILTEDQLEDFQALRADRGHRNRDGWKQ